MRFLSPIRKLKGIKKGERAFIIANGPSVLEYDLEKCNGDVTIGINAATVLQRSNNIIFDYYCVSDRRFLTNLDKAKFSTSYVNKSTTCVYREELSDLVSNKNAYFVRALGRDGFSFDLQHGFFFGCSTTILAVQLAAYIGCSKIYLLGVDLHYKSESPRFYTENVPQIEDSFTSVQIHNMILARKALFAKNVELYTCSGYSLIRPYLKYIDFDSIF